MTTNHQTTFFIETPRLILREIRDEDVHGMFKLDSNPLVHRYLESGYMSESIHDAQKNIDYIKSQYKDHGIGRWAIIEKSSKSFIGWTGLKLNLDTMNGISNFYDIGYRLLPEYWGKGYATESAVPSLEYGFIELNIDTICGIADKDNLASQKVLEKIGLNFTNEFHYKPQNMKLYWYQLSKNDYENLS